MADLSGILSGMICLGLLIGYFEGWGVGDALYFTFVTGLTIGYGITPHRAVSRLLAVGIGFAGSIRTGTCRGGDRAGAEGDCPGRGGIDMGLLIKEIRHNPLLWLLAFVPLVFVAAKLKPGAHTLLFVLSVLAIVPLAALLSHATESVAAKTGDAVGGLLNATLGNLTELVIALTALRAGQYMLVKASIAGAIVTNTLFMLGASFLLGGLKHHVQEFNRAGARLQAGLLFLATVALLVPSAVSEADSQRRSAFTQTERGPVGAAHRRLRAGPAVLAQDPPRVVSAARTTAEDGEAAVADGSGAGDAWPASPCWSRW